MRDSTAPDEHKIYKEECDLIMQKQPASVQWWSNTHHSACESESRNI